MGRKIVFKFFCVIFAIKVQSNEDVLKISFLIIYVVNSTFSLDMHWKFKMFSVSCTVSWVLFQTLLSRYRRLIVNNVFNFYVSDWIPVTSRNMLLKLILQIRKEKKRFETTFKFSPIQSTTGNITETTVAHKSCTISIHLWCTLLFSTE